MYKFESVENQKKFWLPFNDHSATLFYNQRMIVSAPIEEPIAWRITKVENTSPFGINKLTLAQDKFDQHRDFIEKDEYGNVIAMWADYYDDAITNILSNTNIVDLDNGKITFNSSKPQIKIGGSYRTFTATYTNSNDEIIEPVESTWDFYINGTDMNLLPDFPLQIINPSQDSSLSSNQIKVRFIGNDNYLGRILTIKNNYLNTSTEIQIEIVGM